MITYEFVNRDYRELCPPVGDDVELLHTIIVDCSYQGKKKQKMYVQQIHSHLYMCVHVCVFHFMTARHKNRWARWLN